MDYIVTRERPPFTINGRLIKLGERFDGDLLPHRRILALELQRKIRPAGGRPALTDPPPRRRG